MEVHRQGIQHLPVERRTLHRQELIPVTMELREAMQEVEIFLAEARIRAHLPVDHQAVHRTVVHLLVDLQIPVEETAAVIQGTLVQALPVVMGKISDGQMIFYKTRTYDFV